MAPELKRAELPTLYMPAVHASKASMDYDSETDMLYFRRIGAPAVSVSIDGELWLRVDPDSGEVYGFEIEAFEAHFLKRHYDVWALWKLLRDRGAFRGLPADAVEMLRHIWALLKDPRVPALRIA